MAKGRKPPVSTWPSGEDIRNQQYVSAHLAVAALTMAWHYVLKVPEHDREAHLIEKALERTVRLRDKLKKHPRRRRPQWVGFRIGNL